MSDWIAVVDDDVTILGVARQVLGANDMRVSCLKSGEELLTFLGENSPDIILLDIHLPGMDGIEVLNILHSMPQRSHIPVIILTGDSDSHTEARGLASGAMDFIAKPFVPEVLLLRVKHTLQLVRFQAASDNPDTHDVSRSSFYDEGTLGASYHDDEKAYELLSNLRERDVQEGGMLVTYSQFRLLYHYLVRIEQSCNFESRLLILTLRSSERSDEELDILTEALTKAARRALRTGDVVTKESASCALVMLFDTDQENVERIKERIIERWNETGDRAGVEVTYESEWI